jgi:hypothetical protein
MDLAYQLAEHVVLHLNKTKFKFMSLKEVQELLKSKLGDDYTSEVSISVKNILKEHPALDFFKEGTYIEEQRYYHSAGNWIAPKGCYNNPVQAKHKMGWHSWMESENDESYLD